MQWNLRHHLEAAERQRRLAAGLPPVDEPSIWSEPGAGAPADATTVAVGRDTPAADARDPQHDHDDHGHHGDHGDHDDLAELLIDLRDPTSVLAYRPPPAPAPEPPTLPALPRRATPAMNLPVWQRSTLPRGAVGPAAGAATGSTLVRPDARATNQPDLAGQLRTPEPPPTEAPRATRAPVKDRCPHCGGSVRLDRFDLDDAVAQMSCTDCGLQYSVKSPNL